MTVGRQRIGREAEDHVARCLARAGWRVLERNARTRFGELDIVALDGPALVFVEVKAGRKRSIHGPERPVLGVGPDKQLRIRRLASAWVMERRSAPCYREIRFDAVGVTFDENGRVTDCEHIRDAF